MVQLSKSSKCLGLNKSTTHKVIPSSTAKKSPVETARLRNDSSTSVKAPPRQETDKLKTSSIPQSRPQKLSHLTKLQQPNTSKGTSSLPSSVAPKTQTQTTGNKAKSAQIPPADKASRSLQQQQQRASAPRRKDDHAQSGAIKEATQGGPIAAPIPRSKEGSMQPQQRLEKTSTSFRQQNAKNSRAMSPLYKSHKKQVPSSHIPCQRCTQQTAGVKLLVCAKCSSKFHTFCADPPLTSIPDHPWYCTKCSLGRYSSLLNITVVADIGKTRTRAPKPPKKLIEEELSVQVLRGIKRKHKPEGVKRLHSSSSPKKEITRKKVPQKTDSPLFADDSDSPSPSPRAPQRSLKKAKQKAAPALNKQTPQPKEAPPAADLGLLKSTVKMPARRTATPRNVVLMSGKRPRQEDFLLSVDLGKTRTRAPKAPKYLLDEEPGIQVLRCFKRAVRPKSAPPVSKPDSNKPDPLKSSRSLTTSLEAAKRCRPKKKETSSVKDQSEKNQKLTSKIHLVADRVAIGKDGNYFVCHACGQPGKMYMCDGCPKAFHKHCVVHGASKKLLEISGANDDWFCPECLSTTSSPSKPTPQTSDNSKHKGLAALARQGMLAANKQKAVASSASAIQADSPPPSPPQNEVTGKWDPFNPRVAGKKPRATPSATQVPAPTPKPKPLVSGPPQDKPSFSIAAHAAGTWPPARHSEKPESNRSHTVAAVSSDSNECGLFKPVPMQHYQPKPPVFHSFQQHEQAEPAAVSVPRVPLQWEPRIGVPTPVFPSFTSIARPVEMQFNTMPPRAEQVPSLHGFSDLQQGQFERFGESRIRESQVPQVASNQNATSFMQTRPPSDAWHQSIAGDNLQVLGAPPFFGESISSFKNPLNFSSQLQPPAQKENSVQHKQTTDESRSESEETEVCALLLQSAVATEQNEKCSVAEVQEEQHPSSEASSPETDIVEAVKDAQPEALVSGDSSEAQNESFADIPPATYSETTLVPSFGNVAKETSEVHPETVSISEESSDGDENVSGNVGNCVPVEIETYDQDISDMPYSNSVLGSVPVRFEAAIDSFQQQTSLNPTVDVATNIPVDFEEKKEEMQSTLQINTHMVENLCEVFQVQPDEVKEEFPCTQMCAGQADEDGAGSAEAIALDQYVSDNSSEFNEQKETNVQKYSSSEISCDVSAHNSADMDPLQASIVKLGNSSCLDSDISAENEPGNNKLDIMDQTTPTSFEGMNTC